MERTFHQVLSYRSNAFFIYTIVRSSAGHISRDSNNMPALNSKQDKTMRPFLTLHPGSHALLVRTLKSLCLMLLVPGLNRWTEC